MHAVRAGRALFEQPGVRQSFEQVLGVGQGKAEQGGTLGGVHVAGRVRADAQQGTGRSPVEPAERRVEHLTEGHVRRAGQGEAGQRVLGEPLRAVGEPQCRAGEQTCRHDPEGERMVAAGVGQRTGGVGFTGDPLAAECGRQQLVRLVLGERAEALDPAAVRGDQPGESPPAGDEGGDIGARVQQGQHLVGVEHVVEDEQDPAPGVRRPQGGRHLRGDLAGGERHPFGADHTEEVPAAGEAVSREVGRVPGERGLPDPGCSGHHDGRRVVSLAPGEASAQRRGLGAPAGERRHGRYGDDEHGTGLGNGVP
ncbi:hypothetical protein RB196_30725 [Streptomyces sp. PmtA]|uniref:hypothetical protein n=1 Tax=Streptomyces sp. PmtA TaxID=3074275 RepID=UPI003014A9AB